VGVPSFSVQHIAVAIVVLPVRGKAGNEIEPFKWLNILLGNLKTALSGTHHAFKFAKYADRYLAEVIRVT